MDTSTISFLTALYAEACGMYWTLWTLPNRQTIWVRAEDASAPPTPPDNHCVYCSIALASAPGEPNERIRAADADGIVGFVADVDYGKPQAPPTESDAQAVLSDLPYRPTLVVHSGHGLQAWWLFSEPWVFDDDTERSHATDLSRRWQVLVDRAARWRGWTVDHVGDLARVMRVPGTMNHKNPQLPVPVRLLSADGPRYRPDDFDAIAPEAPVEEAVRPTPVAMNGAFPWRKHEALMENSTEYARSWRHNRSDLPDQSLSAYDMSLCSIAARAGWTDEELAALVREHRHTYGEEVKADRADYVARTVARARNGAMLAEREAEAAQRLSDPTEAAPRQAILEWLGAVFGLPIHNIQRFMGTSPILRFAVGDRVVELPQSSLMDQRTWRAKMFILCDRPPKQISKGHSPSWEALITKIIEVAENIEVGPENTTDGETISLVREYLQARTVVAIQPGEAVSRPDTPFSKGGMIWFKIHDLRRYQSHGMGEKMPRMELLRRLRAIGCEEKHHAIAAQPGKHGHGTGRFWGIPESVLARE